MKTFQEKINDCIAAFKFNIEQVCNEEVLRVLAAVPISLELEAVERKRPPKRVTKALKNEVRAKGEKRDAKELDQLTDALLAQIGNEPGGRVEQYHASLKSAGWPGTDRGAGASLKVPLDRLLSAKRIIAKGERRATRYFPAPAKKVAKKKATKKGGKK